MSVDTSTDQTIRPNVILVHDITESLRRMWYSFTTLLTHSDECDTPSRHYWLTPTNVILLHDITDSLRRMWYSCTTLLTHSDECDTPVRHCWLTPTNVILLHDITDSLRRMWYSCTTLLTHSDEWPPNPDHSDPTIYFGEWRLTSDDSIRGVKICFAPMSDDSFLITPIRSD